MLLYIIISIILLIPLAIIIGGALLSAPAYKGPVTDHFDGKTFSNPDGQEPKPLSMVFKWMRERKRDPWTKATDWTIPRQTFDQPEGIRITFVNHSTFLIQIGAWNFLTDPVWSKRVSPFSFMGPARMRPPGVHMDDLPEIHYVLMSHNHYDHLDKATLKKLHQKHQPKIITPLGVGAYIKKIGLNNQSDLDWWQKRELPETEGITITCLPASHFSSRGTLDRNKTLWCGYLIDSPQGTVYFAGDSGNGAFFQRIADNTPHMDIALLPIGAYKPEWFMSPIHTSPHDAVEIHQTLKPGVSIASHFGTFPLPDDNTESALADLKRAKEEAGVAEEGFVALEEGISFEL